MELISLTQEIYGVSQRLSTAAGEIYKLAKRRAETERTYRMELSKQIMTLRAEGIQAALISDLARGNAAQFKFDRDLAESQYRASIEALEALKAQLSALQTVAKYYQEV
jgi:hypothetical protein